MVLNLSITAVTSLILKKLGKTYGSVIRNHYEKN